MIPPSVDLDYVVGLLQNSKRIQTIIKKGKTTFYVFKGTASITKRMVLIRCVDENHTQVDFDFAMAIAIKTKTVPEMMDWLKENRNYKG